MKILYKPKVECTGISASWCPVCGDCTCPRDEDGGCMQDGFDVVEDSECPLHGMQSTHAAIPEPTRLFQAEIVVGADRMLAATGYNHTNREWKVETFTEDLGGGEIAVSLVVRGRVRGEIVPGAGCMGVRVDFTRVTRIEEPTP